MGAKPIDPSIPPNDCTIYVEVCTWMACSTFPCAIVVSRSLRLPEARVVGSKVCVIDLPEAAEIRWAAQARPEPKLPPSAEGASPSDVKKGPTNCGPHQHSPPVRRSRPDCAHKNRCRFGPCFFGAQWLYDCNGYDSAFPDS